MERGCRELLWKFETGGEVWSSPSYNGNEIFIGSDDGFLYCLDTDGKLIWKTKLNGRIRSSSPCLSFEDDQSSSLFIGTYNDGMFCLNQSTGVIKWNKQILKPVMASPATIKDKVFFAASDKRIHCFHAEDGLRIWQFETEDKVWSSPCLSGYDDIMIFGSLDSHIYGIDINTGRQTWKFPTINMLDSSAAIASNMILMGSRDGLLYIFGSEIATFLHKMTQGRFCCLHSITTTIYVKIKYNQDSYYLLVDYLHKGDSSSIIYCELE